MEISFFKRDVYETSRGSEADNYPEIELSDQQCTRIIKKLFCFMNFLLKRNPNYPKGFKI